MRNKPPPPKKTPAKTRLPTKDPVKVFCRIRPLQNGDISCMKVVSPTTVSIMQPEMGVNYRVGNCKEIQYTFKHVFDDQAAQKEIFDNVALPLVEDLIHGRNGLLFTYGVTGSGKTYTMTGDPQNGGIMPRCLDVIFNSIMNFQAKKFVFKPDRMNGFEIQTEADALMDRQNEIYSVRSLRTLKKKDSDSDLIQRTADSTKIENVEEDNTYAVFVTYVEIYNNAVYDLLEEIPEDTLRSKPLQVKIIREDANRNMYVHAVTEKEVKSTEEAFEAFYKGQKRKRMAITTLNSESSRSHSVFTIRLVQAPLDSQGENVLQDRKAICVSQLSLVDLAGSERTDRTKNSGQRLREAGNINNSLMTLRMCLEILRENQMYGTNKMVPYRDSKMTHLFKNYFDGEGQVEMIICVNPRCEDYDETLLVMRFAEMTQEVQVSQPTPLKLDFGLTPGRRKANEIFKHALRKMEENGNAEVQNIDVDIGLVYCLGPPFPSFELTNPEHDKLITDLIAFLELRINKRNILLKDWEQKSKEFRKKLIDIEKENMLAAQDRHSLRACFEQERKKTSVLESRLVASESNVMSLQHKIQQKEAELASLKQELENKEMLLNQQMLEKERLRQKCSDKIAAEKEKNTLQTQKRLKQQEVEFKYHMRDQDEKLRKVKKILTKDGTITSTSRTPLQPARSVANICQTPINTEANLTSNVFSSHSSRRGPAVSNPRHRRSRSAGEEMWLDHRPAVAVELGTVMQPHMKRRKSVTKLTDPKDVVNSKTSKYCLMTQEQDSSGELETRLYKADVVPTSGGGAQVIFNDVETLKQQSPTATPVRKRTASVGELKDTEAACAVSMEGHKRSRY
ncbi:kinesin-like protein KIF23 isoform X2 [Periplaneta americana]